jgi:adenylate kinase family enzyme
VDIAPELSIACGQRLAILQLTRQTAAPHRRARLGKPLVTERSTVLWFAFVRRVSVVGTSGSGKSTLARELAVVLGVPHLELDSVYHQPGWVQLPQDEFRQAVAVNIAGDGWVIDGNYSAVRQLVWARADTVVWLDLPKGTVMRQIIWRTFRRVAGRKELWNGNREHWRNFFSLDPQQSVIAWAWHKYDEYQERYGAAARDPANDHLTFIRLTSRRDITRFLTEPTAFASANSFA